MLNTTKQCKSCNIIKPITDYYWAIDRPNPRSSCRECDRIRIREHYNNNKEKEQTKNKIYIRTDKGKQANKRHRQIRDKQKRDTSDGTIPIHCDYHRVPALVELLSIQKHRCNECNTHISRELGNIQLDHHVPLSRGGTHTLSNVVWLCKECNHAKRARVPDRLLLV